MSDRIEIGAAVPRRRSRVLRAVGRAVLRAFGWRLDVCVPDEPKLVVIAAPHTSNWDFVFGLGAILAVEVDLHWFGKHTIFNGPWGGIFRALGGIAIDRGAPGGVVRQTAQAFTDNAQLIIGLAPEGTRARGTQWKHGFYHLAHSAGVPVLAAYIDHQRKIVGTGPVFRTTGDWDRDIAPVAAFYKASMAKVPAHFTPLV
jgi:1-acyl-sn-glycerol-3-phosphate acyltransferase